MPLLGWRSALQQQAKEALAIRRARTVKFERAGTTTTTMIQRAALITARGFGACLKLALHLQQHVESFSPSFYRDG